MEGLLVSEPTNPYATPTAPTGKVQRAPEEVSRDDRNLAVLSHLGAFVGYAVPFGNVLVPLVLWWLRREQSDFVTDNARESLNFQLTICIYAAICFALIFVLIGIVLAVALAVFQIVYVVLAALAARGGEVYRYPLTIRFVS